MEAVLRHMISPSVSPPLGPVQPGSGDEALVLAARAGDPQAYRGIWEKHGALVERLVRRFFGPGPDHPDVCQEVFLRLFKRLDELRNPSALPGFIVSIALGVARNELRRRRIRAIVGLSPPEELPPAAAPAQNVEVREAVLALYRVLDKLSAEDRSLFVARFVEAMEMAEVAAAHGMSLSTAKRRIARLGQRVDALVKSEPALAEYNGQSTQGGVS